jgi:uncharacterized protein YkwD
MSITRRLGTIAIMAFAVLTVAPAASAAAATPTDTTSATTTISQAERKVVRLINEMRVHDGAVPMQVHAGMMAIARQRSQTNAANHDMQHDLDAVVDAMAARHIHWSHLGEALAYTYEMPLDESAAQAADQWHDSQAHHDLLVDHRHNYLGVGLAIDGSTGRRHWTALVIEGEDVTAPVASMKDAVRAGVTSTGVETTISWRGADVKLSSHTAGIATLDVARSIDGGPWVKILRRTTAREHTWLLEAGHQYAFRVHARDRVGNISTWSMPLVVRT